MLHLNPDYHGELDASFRYMLKSYRDTADEALKQLRKQRPLFVHTDDEYEFSGVRVTNQNVEGLLQTITGVLESISDHAKVFTLRYHIDPHAKKFGLRESQRLEHETIQKIIEKLVSQHRDEEKELRNYLLWGTVSSFSYVA